MSKPPRALLDAASCQAIFIGRQVLGGQGDRARRDTYNGEWQVRTTNGARPGAEPKRRQRSGAG